MLSHEVLTQEEIIKREYELLRQSLDDMFIVQANYFERQTRIFIEYDFNMPQTLFYINMGDITLFGRKTLSQYYLDLKLKSLNCSRITPNMLLGILSNMQYENRKILISYFPITQLEKNAMFDIIVKNRKIYNIEYPFRFRFFDTNLEQTSDDLTWNIDSESIRQLSLGERHFRDYTKEVILKYKLDPKNIYDPACSTGEYLQNIKALLPNSLTIGHDITQEMINYSKDKVDFSFCCNAQDSPIVDESIDLLILRFLNGGVVSSKEAKNLLEILKLKLKMNGYAICFGHTPVLLSQNDFLDNGLQLVEKIGYEKSSNSIFQYYLLKRKW